MQKFIHSSSNGAFTYCYLASEVDARIAELEKRVAARDALIETLRSDRQRWEDEARRRGYNAPVAE